MELCLGVNKLYQPPSSKSKRHMIYIGYAINVSKKLVLARKPTEASSFKVWIGQSTSLGAELVASSIVRATWWEFEKNIIQSIVFFFKS